MPQLIRSKKEDDRRSQQDIKFKQAMDTLSSLLQPASAQAAQMQSVEQNTSTQKQRGDSNILSGLLATAQKMQLNPYQEGISKGLKKSGEQHAIDALSQGVPGDFVAQEAGLTSTGINVNPTQQPNMQNDPQNILQGLVNIPKQGMLETNSNYGITLDNLIKQQTIQGQQPIQPVQQLTADVELAKSRATNAQAVYQAVVQQENTIGKEYSKELEPLKNVALSMTNIHGLFEESTSSPSGTTDLGLVYELIKMYDPNAVKEGEIANVKQAAKSVPQWAINTYNAVFTGQLLSPDLRKKILNTAVAKYNSTQKRYQPIVNQFAEQVKAYGGSPERALINYNYQGKGTKKSSFKVTPVGE